MDRPTTLHYITLQAPSQANVIVCVHENLQVEQVIDLFVVEAEDTLKDYQG